MSTTFVTRQFLNPDGPVATAMQRMPSARAQAMSRGVPPMTTAIGWASHLAGRRRRRDQQGSRVSLFGVSYKPGVGDLRQAPALKIGALLKALGADLVYHDPYVAALPDRDLRGVGFEEALDRCDLAVIVTAHPGVDHDAIAERAPLVLDLRGVTRRSGAHRTVLL